MTQPNTIEQECIKREQKETMLRTTGIDLYLKETNTYKRLATRPNPPARKWFLKMYWLLYLYFFTNHRKNPKYFKRVDNSLLHIPYPKIITSYRKLATELGCTKNVIEYLLYYLRENQIIGMTRAITTTTFNEQRAGSFLWLTYRGNQFIKKTGSMIEKMLEEID